GALTATLGGLDGLVFTAGIGEHAAEIRRRVCERCGWLGLVLDPASNGRGADDRAPDDQGARDGRDNTFAQRRGRVAALRATGEATMFEVSATPLSGKKGLVLGIANEHSIAYGCAKAFRALGADLAITYLNEKAKRFVEPLANELGA